MGCWYMTVVYMSSWQSSSALADEPPFDVGYQCGLAHQTIFDCPYGHLTEQSLRQRHEWLEGYLTALASTKCVSFY